MNTPKLPPLPAFAFFNGDIRVWTSEQMQAYALAAIEAQGVPDWWQPIETAPKDGTPILLATPKGRIADGNWHQKYGVWSWPYVMVEPTLWMPLPSAQIASAPPAPQGKDIKVWGWVWKGKRAEDGCCYLPSYTPEHPYKRGELLALVDPADLHRPLENTDWSADANDTPAPQAGSPNRPSTDWYKAKIMETLDDDFSIGPAPQATRCELCQYQHGHQIGCANNPVDIALKAQAAVVQQKPLSREEREVVMSSIRDSCDLIHAGVMQQEPVAWLTEPTSVAHSGLKRDVTFHRPPEKPDWTVRPLVYGDTHTAQQAKPQPLSDARIAELERQLAEARKDAERYRWLRLKIYIDPKERILRISDTYLTRGTTVQEMLDAAIDNAMQKG